MAKYAAAEAALAAVDAAIQTHGGNGLAAEYGLVPLWGIARLLRIAPVNARWCSTTSPVTPSACPVPTRRPGPRIAAAA